MTEIVDLDHVSRVREFGTVGKFEDAIALLKHRLSDAQSAGQAQRP